MLHNPDMTSQNLPLRRTTVGGISLGCLIAGICMTPWAADSSSVALWQGGLVRGGLLAGAVWLALPGRNHEAAWANLSPKTIAFLLMGLIVTIRIPLRILVPAALLGGILFLLLRPRPKKRPGQSVAQ